MNMQFSQRIAQKQGLVMTGQLQQAIALLQLSNSDLQSFVERQAEENPFVQVTRPAASERRTAPSLPSQRGGGDDFDFLGNQLADNPLSLYGHVAAQFDLMFQDPADRMIADEFMEALEPSGWLGEPLEDIAFRCGLTMEEAEEMLHLVQRVEPAGLFARNLSECLSIQAEDRGMMTPVFRTVLDNLPRLAAADLNGLRRLAGCTMD